MRIIKNGLLASYSSYQIGGQADIAFPSTSEELFTLITDNKKNGIPFYIFGYGSNLLFPDNPSRKCQFISLSLMNYCTIQGDSLKVSAGFPISQLALVAYHLQQKNLYFTYLLPGSVGAATYINAKYFDCSFSDSIMSVTFLNNPYENPEFITFTKDQCNFSYKNSIFQTNHGIITEIVLKYEAKADINDPNLIISDSITHSSKNTNSFFSLESFFNFYASSYKTLILNKYKIPFVTEFEDIIKDRISKKHFDYPSCGSVFKNNYSIGVPMGKLIDEIGLRGFSHGGAQISPYHGNIIINKSKAKAEDVKYLISHIQDKVNDAYNFVPECEVQIIE